MITKEKIDIYVKYKGNGDLWARGGSKKEKIIINDEDWSLIDNLTNDLFLASKNLASSTFIESLRKRLKDSCSDDYVLNKIDLIVKNYNEYY